MAVPFIRLMLSSGQSSAPSLMSLPNEVLANIVKQVAGDFRRLDPYDVKALRLTCKHIHAFATEEFAKREFRHLFITLSNDSLQKFVAICQRFGKWVRRVDFDSARAKPGELGYLVGELTKSPDYGDTSFAADVIEAFIARIRREADLKHSDEAAKQLSIGFKSIARHRHPMCISISDRRDTSIPGDDLSHLFGICESRIWMNDFPTVLQMMANAAIGSGCNVLRLEIMSKFASGTESDEADIDIQNNDETRAFWSGLLYFYLDLNQPLPESCIRQIRQGLSQAKLLKRFVCRRFVCLDRHAAKCFESVVDSIASTSIEGICILSPHLPVTSMTDLFRRNRRLITSIHHHCTLFCGRELEDSESPTHHSWIGENLCSYEFLVLRADGADDEASYIPNRGFTRTRLTGRENVMSGLEELIENRPPSKWNP